MAQAHLHLEREIDKTGTKIGFHLSIPVSQAKYMYGTRDIPTVNLRRNWVNSEVTSGNSAYINIACHDNVVLSTTPQLWGKCPTLAI
jgi:hypothetical protein